MLLYFKPGACSLAPRIVLTELGLEFDAIQVDTDAGTTQDGSDYRAVNPKGYVPALAIAPDTILTENPAILQYLADQAPHTALAPQAGTLARARLQEWLNFTSSELHKAFSPWFGGRLLEGEDRIRAEAVLHRRIGDVEQGLSDGRAHILGGTFTIADAYLFVVLSWSHLIGVDPAQWPSVSTYLKRIAARPLVRAALAAEGLLQDGVGA